VNTMIFLLSPSPAVRNSFHGGS